MGVIPVNDIDYGQIFGPFPSHLAMADPAYLIAMLTNDKRQEGVFIKLDLSERKEGIKAVDWLPYIHPARNEDEQNVEAYMKEGQVYYRTLRIVKAGEELLVWYSKDFCHLLNIPDVQRNRGKHEDYICPQCGEVFEYAFPMRAHLKFRCMMGSTDIRTFMENQQRKHHGVIPGLSSAESTRQKTYHCDTDLLREGLPNRSGDSPDSLPLELSPRRREPLELSPRRREQLELSPRRRDIDCISVSRKRHSSSSELSPPEKKVCTETKDPLSLIKVSESKEVPPVRKDNGTKHSEFENHSEGASAFRKVEKSMSPAKEQVSPLRPEASITSSLSRRISDSLSSRNSTHVPPSVVMASPSTSIPMMQQSQLLSLYMPRLPVLPQLPLSANLAPTSIYGDRTSVRLAEMCPPQMTRPLTERFTNVRNRDSTSDIFVKQQQMMFAETNNMAYPHFLKSHNPMVEKMIHSGTNPTQINSPMAAMDLSQNWCAKCNASFRMTSDLVYHMRSHHKREFDPVKKKRDDKLRCHICSETFRERHHLTRHMTSHV